LVLNVELRRRLKQVFGIGHQFQSTKETLFSLAFAAAIGVVERQLTLHLAIIRLLLLQSDQVTFSSLKILLCDVEPGFYEPGVHISGLNTKSLPDLVPSLVQHSPIQENLCQRGPCKNVFAVYGQGFAVMILSLVHFAFLQRQVSEEIMRL